MLDVGQAVAERTRDLLSTTIRVAELVNGQNNPKLAEVAEKLAIRLEFGVPEELVEIARRAGSRLTRGNYLSLWTAGYVSLEAIRAASDDDLARVLGSRPIIGVLRSIAAVRATEQ
jgi:hypothetical protein